MKSPKGKRGERRRASAAFDKGKVDLGERGGHQLFFSNHWERKKRFSMNLGRKKRMGGEE